MAAGAGFTQTKVAGLFEKAVSSRSVTMRSFHNLTSGVAEHIGNSTQTPVFPIFLIIISMLQGVESKIRRRRTQNG